jgi:hypothetical protein
LQRFAAQLPIGQAVVRDNSIIASRGAGPRQRKALSESRDSGGALFLLDARSKRLCEKEDSVTSPGKVTVSKRKIICFVK